MFHLNAFNLSQRVFGWEREKTEISEQEKRSNTYANRKAVKGWKIRKKSGSMLFFFKYFIFN